MTDADKLAEAVKALEDIAKWQRDLCLTAGEEMLFILLENKVERAQTALAKLREADHG